MENKKRVLVDPYPRKLKEIFSDGDWGRLTEWFDLVWAKDEQMPMELFERERHDLFAVICCGWRFGKVEEITGLRAILEVGGGLPKAAQLDYEACFSRHIRVLSCAPAFGPMVAEMALAMALACTREIVLGDRLFRKGEERYLHAGNEHTYTLYGRKVGFIGYGGLVRSLKPLLEPFGCELHAYDPWLTEAYLRRDGVIPSSLEELMASCDVIFVLAVPTKSNKAMLSREYLEMIRPDSVLVLMSRAHVVDFEALTELVAKGRFRAAVDVFPEEPFDKAHPIRRAEGVVLSAHRAGSTADDLRTIGRMVADDIEAIARGLPPHEMQNAEPELVDLL